MFIREMMTGINIGELHLIKIQVYTNLNVFYLQIMRILVKWTGYKTAVFLMQKNTFLLTLDLSSSFFIEFYLS